MDEEVLPMPEKNFKIRNMSREELDSVIDWAANEGWNPGLYDAENYFAADPNGFLIGLLDDEPIASISVVRYGDSFGFLGFYLVKPEYRGKGYGIELWNAGLKYLQNRTIGLDGVVAQQPNYQKAGFQLAHQNIRYEGIGGGLPPENSNIQELSTIPFHEIDAYDRPFFPENRAKFLQGWINQPESTALGIMQNGKLAGYGVIRPCRSGHKVGPLFADNSELAESLFFALKASAKPGAPVYLDIPEVNRDAVALVKYQQMKYVFETARMYSNGVPDVPSKRLFGVTSFELG
jgi:RimJ/RimL family protein N-acetyltransferase